MPPDFELEREVAQRIDGKRVAVCGIDEVGVGAIAGPIVAAAVVLDPRQPWTSKIQDSKQLTPAKRAELCMMITQNALCQATAETGAFMIDQKGIARARLFVMELCFARVQSQLGAGVKLAAVVDGRFLRKYAARFGGAASLFIDKADQRSLSVAAASIVAKIMRDNMMCELALDYPEYDWCHNRGYPTPRHVRLLETYGPSPFHRRTFGPVRRVI